MNLFENLQCVNEQQKVVLERDSLTIDEYNKLKYALNKNNSLRGNFILHPGRVNVSEYYMHIRVYGAFRNQEHSYTKFVNGEKIPSDEFSKHGLGLYLYDISINLIDENVRFIDNSYIYDYKTFARRYNDFLINSDVIKQGEIDQENLVNTIKSIAEQSKIDVEKVLHSKNFIYNLTGKKHFNDERDKEYNLSLESTTLTEDFDPSMPNWLKRAIKLQNNATYGHKDREYNLNLDTLKWVVDKFPEKGNWNNIANGEYVALLIDKSGDEHNGYYTVYCPQLYIGDNETIYINGRERSIRNMSIKTLSQYVKEFAYTVNGNENKELIKQKQIDRMNSRKDLVKRVNPDDYWYFDKPNIDKSGYIVDPDKYTKLLAQLHLQDYIERLEDLYCVLTEIKGKIKEYISSDDFLADAKTNDSPYQVSNGTKASQFEKINDSYNESIKYYRYALKEIDNIKNNTDSSTFSRTPSFKNFNDYIKQSENKIATVLTYLDKK